MDGILRAMFLSGFANLKDLALTRNGLRLDRRHLLDVIPIYARRFQHLSLTLTLTLHETTVSSPRYFAMLRSLKVQY